MPKQRALLTSNLPSKWELHKGIDSYWAAHLFKLYLDIVTSNPKNGVADGLSQSFFPDDCKPTDATTKIAYELAAQGPQWVRNEGNGGFEDMLNRLNKMECTEVTSKGAYHSAPMRGLSVNTSMRKSAATLSLLPSTSFTARPTYLGTSIYILWIGRFLQTSPY